MEEEGGGKEIEKNAILQESRECFRLAAAFFLNRTASAGVVNLLAIDKEQREGCRDGEYRGDHEYSTVAEFVAYISD